MPWRRRLDELARGEVGDARVQRALVELALRVQGERARRNHDSALERRVNEGVGFDRKEGTYTVQSPVVRAEPRVGRNDPCPCGSGQKYKKCLCRACLERAAATSS